MSLIAIGIYWLINTTYILAAIKPLYSTLKCLLELLFIYGNNTDLKLLHSLSSCSKFYRARIFLVECFEGTIYFLCWMLDIVLTWFALIREFCWIKVFVFLVILINKDSIWWKCKCFFLKREYVLKFIVYTSSISWLSNQVSH